MASMRLVTRKLKMLTEAMMSARKPKILASTPPGDRLDADGEQGAHDDHRGDRFVTLAGQGMQRGVTLHTT